MHKQVDKTLLQSYFREECSKDQLTIISHYLNDAEYRDSLNKFLCSDWLEVGDEKVRPYVNAEESYKRFLEITGQINSMRFEKENKKIHSLSFYWLCRVAAAIIVIISVSGFIWWNSSSKENNSQCISVHNEAGKKTFFYLPDSSKVYLGAASKLDYNRDYGITNRNLRLKGEAYFIVKHEGKHPFSVTTGKITTVDIGTEFNIRFLENSTAIEVSVAKGSVEVLNNTGKDKHKLATLAASQQLSVDTALQNIKINFLKGSKIGSWRNGLLVFEKQTFRSVAIELERYYGLTINFADPDLADIIITTTLKNTTANEALDIIALTTGVKMKRNENHVLVE